MAHFVYENWTRQKAVIHIGECGHCNHGKGVHAVDSGRNGRWHGAFDTREDSMRHAKALKRPDTRACAVCGG